MGIIAQDTGLTGGRGSGNPGAWNSGSDGNSWQTVIGQVYTLGFSSNELTATGQTAIGYQPYTTSTTQGHGIEIWVRAKAVAATTEFGVFFACDGTANNLYAVDHSAATGNTLEIVKISGGTRTVEQSTAFTTTAGSFYWVKAKWDTSNVISAKIWLDGNSEPAYQITWTDGSPFTSGSFGVIVKGQSNGNVLNMDHFLIQTIPTSSTVLGSTLSLMGVG